jgi:hypothetical protein
MDVVVFLGKKYKLVVTEHARLQMQLRDIPPQLLKEVIELGEVKEKDVSGKYWIYKKVKGRKDNLICASVSVEKPRLIVITTLINWRPK